MDHLRSNTTTHRLRHTFPSPSPPSSARNSTRYEGMGSKSSIENKGLPRFLFFVFFFVTVATLRLFLFDGGERQTASVHRSKSSSNTHQQQLHNHPINPELKAFLSANLSTIDTVYVIPGGGSKDGEYPEWTKQRTLAAYNHSLQHPNSVFIALSAGSFNAPNQKMKDGRIIFECQFTMNQLLELGVSKDRVYGDWQSWDTVFNAFVARMFVEGILAMTATSTTENSTKNTKSIPRLNVEVFISDFHTARVKAACEWTFGLTPNLLENADVLLNIHSVNSSGIAWTSVEEYDLRVQHEAKGTEMIQKNAAMVKTIPEFYAFMLLGGHGGYRGYLSSNYTKSKGAGWSTS